MWLLWIYVGFSLLTFVLLMLEIVVVGKKALQKYSDRVDETKKKKYSLDAFFENLKLLIVSFIPVINCVLFFTVLLGGDKLEKEIMDKVDAELEEKEKEQW